MQRRKGEIEANHACLHRFLFSSNQSRNRDSLNVIGCMKYRTIRGRVTTDFRRREPHLFRRDMARTEITPVIQYSADIRCTGRPHMPRPSLSGHSLPPSPPQEAPLLPVQGRRGSALRPASGSGQGRDADRFAIHHDLLDIACLRNHAAADRTVLPFVIHHLSLHPVLCPPLHPGHHPAGHPTFDPDLCPDHHEHHLKPRHR